MCDCAKSTRSTRHGPPVPTLEQRQAWIREVRDAFLGEIDRDRAEAWRALLLDLVARRVLTLGEVGRVDLLEDRDSHAALVELLCLLAFPGQWPTDPQGAEE
jgi:hypothetical protein